MVEKKDQEEVYWEQSVDTGKAQNGVKWLKTQYAAR